MLTVANHKGGTGELKLKIKVVINTLIFEAVAVLSSLGILYLSNLKVEIKPNVVVTEVTRELGSIKK